MTTIKEYLERARSDLNKARAELDGLLDGIEGLLGSRPSLGDSDELGQLLAPRRQKVSATPKVRMMRGVWLAKGGGQLIAREDHHVIYKLPYEDMLKHFAGKTTTATAVDNWLARKWRMSPSQGAYYRRHAMNVGKIEALRKDAKGGVLLMGFK